MVLLCLVLCVSRRAEVEYGVLFVVVNSIRRWLSPFCVLKEYILGAGLIFKDQARCVLHLSISVNFLFGTLRSTPLLFCYICMSRTLSPEVAHFCYAFLHLFSKKQISALFSFMCKFRLCPLLCKSCFCQGYSNRDFLVYLSL